MNLKMHFEKKVANEDRFGQISKIEMIFNYKKNQVSLSEGQAEFVFDTKLREN